MWEDTHRRKPMLLLRLSGELWLRLAARQFLALLFQEPPRSTRDALRGPDEPCGPRAKFRSKNFATLRVVQ